MRLPIHPLAQCVPFSPPLAYEVSEILFHHMLADDAGANSLAIMKGGESWDPSLTLHKTSTFCLGFSQQFRSRQYFS